MKYISITTSANFGNMISMALASFFLPFLPLLATQILLNNLLSSVPSLAIAGDNVDAELVQKPRRWDIGSVRRFMVSFGLVSSAFDMLTFGFLLLVMDASADRFRTGWFVESLLTQLAIVLVVRTQQAVWKSRPSRFLGSLTVAVAMVAVTLPYLPNADWLGFVALPLPMLAGLVAISTIYVVISEGTKRWFFSRKRAVHHHGADRRRPSRMQ
jgi:Mg2+-importing ATPase